MRNTQRSLRRWLALSISKVFAAAVLALSITAAISSAPASAGTVSCGEKISADTTLQNDLLNCPNRGIVIGADDITLDLNGHTVDGDAIPFASCPENSFCDVGIFSHRDDDVVIKDGTVHDFDAGVFVGKSRRTELHAVTASENESFGFVVALSTGVEVTRSSGVDGPSEESDGMGLFASSHLRVARNDFSRNDELGIHMFETKRSSITRNEISENPSPLFVEDSNRNRLSHNLLEQNGGGVALLGSRNEFTYNRIIEGDGGVSMEDGHDNLLAGNRIEDPGTVGIRVGAFEPTLIPRDTVVRENVVEGAGRIGILVTSRTGHTTVRGNRVSHAQRDGIQLQDPDASVARNHASQNGRYGIYANKGVHDGGGNEAAGNSHQPQCRNVACG